MFALPSLAWAFACAAFWAASDLCSKKAVGGGHLVTIEFWASLLGAVPFVALFLYAPQPLSFSVLPIVAFVGFATAMAFAAYFKGLRVGEVSIVQPIITTDGIMAAVIAVVFLAEPLTTMLAIALGLGFAGVLFVSFKLKGRGRHLFLTAASAWGWMAAIFFGAGLAASSLLAKVLTEASATMLFALATSSFLAIYMMAKNISFSFPRKQWKWIAGSGILDSAGVFAFFAALKGAPASLVAPIATVGSVLLLLLLAKFMLKERLDGRETLGIAFIVAALALLSL